jgi:hypothetical protein
MSTPDQLLRTALRTEAERLALERGRIEAVEALRELAGGREDIVADSAGLLGGYWTVRAAQETGYAPIAAGLLILAGPDRDLLQEWVDVGRERAGRAGLRAGPADGQRQSRTVPASPGCRRTSRDISTHPPSHTSARWDLLPL